MTPFFWLRWVRRIVLLLLTIAVLSFLFVAFRVWWTARDDSRPRSDVILVLGASQYDGRPSPVFKARLDHARALYDESVAPRIITVGGKQPADRFTEAAAGATYLAAHGVPRSALVVVPEGRDTLASLRAVDKVLDQRHWKTAVVVTDPWHSLRSRTMARDLGIKASASPTRTGPSVQSRGTEVHYIARETLAFVYYKIFHSDNEHAAGAL